MNVSPGKDIVYHQAYCTRHELLIRSLRSVHTKSRDRNLAILPPGSCCSMVTKRNEMLRALHSFPSSGPVRSRSIFRLRTSVRGKDSIRKATILQLLRRLVLHQPYFLKIFRSFSFLTLLFSSSGRGLITSNVGCMTEAGLNCSPVPFSIYQLSWVEEPFFASKRNH